MYNLFLDDERFPPDDGKEWMIFRTAEAAKLAVINCVPAHISFDHDLGSQESGYDFAKWLVERDIDLNILDESFTFAVHSMNPIGAANIQNLLNRYLQQKHSI